MEKKKKPIKIIDHFGIQCSVDKSKEIEKAKKLEIKLEELKQGHGTKMSADKFLKELSKW